MWNRSRRTGWVPALLLLIPSSSFGAASVGLPDLNLPNPADYIDDSLVRALVRTVGMLTEQRPYEPATPQGLSLGLEISFEATLMQSPKDLADAASSLAGSGGTSSIPSIPLPIARLQVHKGMGDIIDIGGSVLYIPTVLRVWGADVKSAVFMPEEGPTFAIRLCYSSAQITQTVSGIVLQINTMSLSPQILMSRKIDFADPYIGIGGTYIWGDVYVSVPTAQFVAGQIPAGFSLPAGTVPDTLEATKKATSYGAVGFLGVALRIPRTGLRVTLEMAYSPFGMNTAGAKVGFNF